MFEGQVQGINSWKIMLTWEMSELITENVDERSINKAEGCPDARIRIINGDLEVPNRVLINSGSLVNCSGSALPSLLCKFQVHT